MFPLLLDLGQTLLERLDLLVDHAAVQLDLGFARATSVTHTAALALQVGPAAHQARREVLQPCELNLQLALVAARAGTENFEDEADAVEHLHTQVALKVELLGGRQGLIEDHGLGLVEGDDGFDLVGLARANEQRCIGRFALGRDLGHRRIPRRLGQQGEFVQRGIERRAGAEIDPDEDNPRVSLREQLGIGAVEGVKRDVGRGGRSGCQGRRVRHRQAGLNRKAERSRKGRSTFFALIGTEVHCTAGDDRGDGVLVNHLRDRVAQQDHVLIEGFDVALELDAVDQVNGHRHVLTTQKVQEGVL